MITRIPIFISTFLLCTCVMMAQDVTDRFRIGISAGLERNVSSEKMAFSQYTGFTSDYDEYNYSFGLNLEYLLKTDLSINGAINYSNKDFIGAYFCDVCNIASTPFPREVDFSFIEVPITLKYYFLPHRIRLFGEAGFDNLFPLDDLGYESRANAYSIGFKLGGGMEYNLSKKIALQLTMDYTSTISKMFKESYYKGPNFKLRTINFGIAILKKI